MPPPYAASDDDDVDSPPPAAAGASSGGKRDASKKPRESRSSFKEHVIKEVKSALRGYYSAGRIASKEDYKELARDLSHRILSKEPSRTAWDAKMPNKVRKYVDGTFSKDFIYDPSQAKKSKDTKKK